MPNAMVTAGRWKKRIRQMLVPQQEGQADATRSKAINDYDLDVDYEPVVSDLDIKAVYEEEENFDAEYAKMEFLEPGHCIRG